MDESGWPDYFGYHTTPWVASKGVFVVMCLTVIGFRQRRIGTRGSDKGAKEEIKQAIRRQVLRSNEPLDELIVKFLSQERGHIVQTLI